MCSVYVNMILPSLSVKRLQHMIDICFQYSQRWYQYNPAKCGIIVINESTKVGTKANRM